MGNTLYHTLVNPNQLRNYGTQVQYNQMSKIPLYIITEDGEFRMDIAIEATTVFANTHTHTF